MKFHPDRLSQTPREFVPAQKLYEMIGGEHGLGDVDRTARLYVQSLRPPIVGAFHLTCSDESERECVEIFQRGFVRSLLPSLKFSAKSPFRGANLGGRYEWGAVRIAEEHFAMAESANDWKLIFVKINSHVGVVGTGPDFRYGSMIRYGGESPLCGALNGLLAGSQLPFAKELNTIFQAEGIDRVGALRDPARVEKRARPLIAALVAARLQARRVMIDIQDSQVTSPTLFIVMPCVTLNKAGHDSEIPVGIYHADRRGEAAHDEYFGLGDDPEDYVLSETSVQISVRDSSLKDPRAARDHRELTLSTWRSGRVEGERVDQRALDAIGEAHSTASDSGGASPYKKAALLTAMGVLMEFAPIPAALVLFGQGIVQIHHAAQAQMLARRSAGDKEAREMLAGIRDQVDSMNQEQVENLTALLAAEYGVA